MALPLDILFGLYLGVLVGIVPALVAGSLGFAFKYFTEVTIPGFGVVVLSLALAGVNGGLLALSDETIRNSDNAAAVLTAIIVVLMLSFYAHAQGDKLAGAVPKRITIRTLRERNLSRDVVELVGDRKRVRVTVVGEVEGLEGYPPLPAELARRIADGEWTFPADLPLPELEARVADRLAAEFDLADAQVSLDERARASVAAAPPVGGLSKRVPEGERAVSVSALVPAGLARGEALRLETDAGTVEGTLVSAVIDTPSGERTADEGGDDGGPPVATDGGEGDAEPEAPPASAPVTSGGEGRVTVSVRRKDVRTLLAGDRARVVVRSRGTRREFELLSLLRRDGKRIRRLTVAEGGPLDGTTLGEAELREAYDVVVLAARRDRWRVAPRGAAALRAGDELYVAGTRDALDRLAEAAA